MAAKLSDGKEIEIDLSKIKVIEYDQLKNPAFMDEDSYEVVSKVTGLSVEDIKDRPMDDLRRIVGAIIQKARQPLFDPN